MGQRIVRVSTREPESTLRTVRYNSPDAFEGTLRFVSPALKYIVFPALSWSGYLRYTAGAGPAIVTYHGVFPAGYEVRSPALDGNLVHADSLRRQLQLLKKRYRVITPEDFLHWAEGKISLPPRSILLTCDDALRNTLTEMVPILREFGLSCLFFATGASADETPSMLWYEELYLMLLDASDPITLSLPVADVRVGPIAPSEKHAGWWNLVERLSQFDRELRRRFLDQIRDQLKLSENWRERFVQDPTLAARFLTLDIAGLRQLAAAGMTIGAHSLSHPILARASEELAWEEISESRSVLEKALGQMVWAFGYPFGNASTVTGRDLQLAERAGFRCAFMNTEGGLGAKVVGAKVVDAKIVDAKINRFALPRVHVTAAMSLFEFEAHISGFYRRLRKKLMGGDELEAVVGA
jgi:peptidoglycan/xylan/chitin deacetylase (PgdA/CDA1 family)